MMGKIYTTDLCMCVCVCVLHAIAKQERHVLHCKNIHIHPLRSVPEIQDTQKTARKNASHGRSNSGAEAS